MKIAALSAIVAASSFTLASFALSETYRTEISANYGETDSDYYSGDNYSVGLSAKLYFSPVDTAGLPLAEAAFLQKASSFSFSLANSEYEYQGDNRDAYLRGANLTYYVPNSIFLLAQELQKISGLMNIASVMKPILLKAQQTGSLAGVRQWALLR